MDVPSNFSYSCVVFLVQYLLVMLVQILFFVSLSYLLAKKLKKAPEFSKQPGFSLVILEFVVLVLQFIAYGFLLTDDYQWIAVLFFGIALTVCKWHVSIYLYSL